MSIRTGFASTSVPWCQKRLSPAIEGDVVEEKMKLLCQTGVIDEDIFIGMLQVIDDLETHWGARYPRNRGGWPSCTWLTR